MGNKSVKVGVKARDLEEQGVAYEPTGVVPELPDYLGYLAGLLLVWLIYTGYQSAVVAMKKPITKISEHAVTIKNKVDEFTTDETVKAAETAAASNKIATAPAKKTESSSWWSKLDRVNIGISRAVDYTNNMMNEWFFEDDFDGPSSKPPMTQRARPKRDAGKMTTSENGEELEWF